MYVLNSLIHLLLRPYKTQSFSFFLISLQVISSPLLSFPYSFLVPVLHINLLSFIALSQHSFSSLLLFDLVSPVTTLPRAEAQRQPFLNRRYHVSGNLTLV